MNSKHTKTLKSVFKDPVSKDIRWRDIELLLCSLDAELIEGRGSRVRFNKDGSQSMSSTLSFQGYSARVEFSSEDECFIGHIAGIQDIIGFHGDSVNELKLAFEEAVRDYLETCLKVGKHPQKPYSGKLMLRITPEIHAAVATAAQLRGISINQWAQEALGREAFL